MPTYRASVTFKYGLPELSTTDRLPVATKVFYFQTKYPADMKSLRERIDLIKPEMAEMIKRDALRMGCKVKIKSQEVMEICKTYESEGRYALGLPGVKAAEMNICQF